MTLREATRTVIDLVENVSGYPVVVNGKKKNTGSVAVYERRIRRENESYEKSINHEAIGSTAIPPSGILFTSRRRI